MGCDIHVAFETRVDGKWVPLFPVKPADWWREKIIDAKIADGSGKLMTGSDDYQVQFDALEKYFADIPDDEAEDRFGHHPKFPVGVELPEITCESGWKTTIATRDYSFFGLVAQVRWHSKDGFEPRGLPDDCDPKIRHWATMWGDDAHSHSWLMVDELLGRIEQVQKNGEREYHFQKSYLELIVTDPSNTRMVFWFDN